MDRVGAVLNAIVDAKSEDELKAYYTPVVEGYIREALSDVSGMVSGVCELVQKYGKRPADVLAMLIILEGLLQNGCSDFHAWRAEFNTSAKMALLQHMHATGKAPAMVFKPGQEPSFDLVELSDDERASMLFNLRKMAFKLSLGVMAQHAQILVDREGLSVEQALSKVMTTLEKGGDFDDLHTEQASTSVAQSEEQNP